MGWEYGNDTLTELNSAIPGAVITSGKRTPKGNSSLPGSVPNSGHLRGDKIDIVPGRSGLTADQIAARVRALGGNPLIESDHVDTSFPGADFPYIGAKGSEGQGPNTVQLGKWEYGHADDSPTPNAGLVEGDPVYNKTTPSVPTPDPTVSSVAKRGYNEAVGSNLGLDQGGENDKLFQWAKNIPLPSLTPKADGSIPTLYDAINGGVITMEGLQGAANAGVAGLAQFLGTSLGMAPKAAERMAGSWVEFSNVGGMFAGGVHPSGAGAVPPELISNLQRMREAGASNEELIKAAGPYELRGLDEAQPGSRFVPANEDTAGVGIHTDRPGVTAKDVTKERQAQRSNPQANDNYSPEFDPVINAADSTLSEATDAMGEQVGKLDNWKARHDELKKTYDDLNDKYQKAAKRLIRPKNFDKLGEEVLKADEEYNNFLTKTDPTGSPPDLKSVPTDDLSQMEQAKKIWEDEYLRHAQHESEDTPIDVDGPAVNAADEAVKRYWADPGNDRRSVSRDEAQKHEIDVPTLVGEDPGPDVTPPDVIDKLRSALDKAEPARVDVSKSYKEARAQRIARMKDVRGRTFGESGYHTELGALKGKLGNDDFTPIRHEFDQGDLNSLFDTVRDHPYEGPHGETFDPIRARTGLTKLLDGQIPTEGELRLLRQVFPKDVIDRLPKRANKASFRDHVANVLNVPRSLMSSIDLSAPFRQGVTRVHTREFWNAFGSMFKYAVSEKAFKGLQEDIHSRPNAGLYEDFDLAVGDPGDVTHQSISKREEQFMSSYAEKIPVVGRLVRGSDRAYSGFLHKLRADTFDKIYDNAKTAGVDVDEQKFLKDLAGFVNNSTGRGSLGRLNSSAPLLSTAFFSPRLIASRLQLLNPEYYVILNPTVRKEAIKQAIAFGGLATTVISMFKMAGADVETDMRSTDWGKIRFGHTRYDILGGFQQYLRLGAQLATGETKSIKGVVRDLTGNKFPFETRADKIGQFVRSKEAPIPSTIHDALAGKNVIGQPFDAKTEAVKLFTPLFIQDVTDAYKDKGLKGILQATPGAFGVGVQTFDPNKKKTKPKTETKGTWSYAN